MKDDDRLLFLHLRSMIDACLLAQADLYESGPRGEPFICAVRRVRRVYDQLLGQVRKLKNDDKKEESLD